ncbi:MAG: 4'-phosphopantetheinyl transferase superfamily protein [Clostridia bacterium]|nr:4'-phosphopantetheinyl transferase superfamily protein [Clostridia bacterium]
MTHIFVSTIPQTFDEQRSAECFKRVFEGEKNQKYLENIMKKSHAEARAQSLYALEVLAHGLKSLKIDSSSLTLAKTSSGKPYFEGEMLYFSLSHDADTVAAAISDRDVGVDIQSSKDATRENAIAKRFFAQDECEGIRSGNLDFLTAWTRREAYAKLTDTPLASLTKKELPDSAFFETLDWKTSKITVATLSSDEVKITLLS